MAYDPFVWENGSAGGTPITAERLNAIEVGIQEAATGEHVHAASAVTVAAGDGIVGADAQAVIADLAARVVALEAAAE